VAGRHVDEGPAERGDDIADVDLLAHAGCGALSAVRLQRTLQPCHHLADLLRESAASCHSRRKISQPGGLWRLRSNRSSRGKDLFLVSWNLFDDGASTSMQGSSQQIGTRCQDSITNKMRGPFIVTGRGLLRTAGRCHVNERSESIRPPSRCFHFSVRLSAMGRSHRHPGCGPGGSRLFGKHAIRHQVSCRYPGEPGRWNEPRVVGLRAAGRVNRCG
jgi:hypothetical protein